MLKLTCLLVVILSGNLILECIIMHGYSMICGSREWLIVAIMR